MAKGDDDRKSGGGIGDLFGGVMDGFNSIMGFFGTLAKWGGMLAVGIGLFSIIGKWFGDEGFNFGNLFGGGGGNGHDHEEDNATVGGKSISEHVRTTDAHNTWARSSNPDIKPEFTLPFKGEGRVSSDFGMREHPTLKKQKMHHGLDFAASGDMLAMANGTVLFAGPAGSAGNVVAIGHDGGYVSYYFHMKDIDVKVGEPVKAAQAIGDIGKTGRSLGVHAHVEIRDSNNNALDPAAMIEAQEDKTIAELVASSAIKTGKRGTVFRVETATGEPVAILSTQVAAIALNKKPAYARS